jgi:hypothetical protein
LNAFAYLFWVIQITSERSSLCSNLAYTLRSMAPTPHAVMPKNRRMWLEVNLTSVDLWTLGLYYKSPWSLFYSKVACFLALVIGFCSLQHNHTKGLLKTFAFIAAWSWTFGACSWVNGHPGLFSSMVTLGCTCNYRTKLYLAI